MNSLSYGYLDANHRHALTHVNGVEKYKYDAAGNMYERDSASLSYDIQNRLRSIWENGQPKGEFTYDSYGARMYEYIPATNSSRRYIGEHYEWAVYGTYKKYYLIGGVRVAFTDVVNQQPTLYWLLQDHLGSTAVTAETNGNVEGKVWYYPYGEKRDGQGDPRTTYLFTGQRQHPVSGLYWYRSRWYDPVIGRFVQADTLVPDPANPQSLNRYAYVLNNPLRYTDPTGHAVCVDEECSLVFHPVSGEIIRRGPGASYWNQSGMGLFWDWYFEQGPETRYYGRAAALTKDVMNDEGVQAARDVFYRSPGEQIEYPYGFGRPIQPIREAAQWLSGEDKTGAGSVLGSYTVYIANNRDGTITIWVHNITGRESGSRLLGSGPILETAPTEYYEQLWSGVQEMLSGDASLGSLKKLWPVSVFENRTREQTGPSSLPWVGANGWGGDLEQWYMWTEALCTDCM